MLGGCGMKAGMAVHQRQTQALRMAALQTLLLLQFVCCFFQPAARFLFAKS